MPDTRLTWHVGSVLPYASLWHTVLRACALNVLHPHDLPSPGARPPATVALLERAAGVDVAAFARLLGETPDAFRWSTLGALPSWLSAALVVPQPRLCFACLAAGYHAALYSVALLDACPIHGTPLVDRCHCGAPFRAMLHSQADYAAAGSCHCGRLHFFTHETCRRPTLAPGATRVLDPLAAWLDALPELIRSARLDEALGQAAPGSLEWVLTAAQALGLAYPACLRPISFVPPPVGTAWYQVAAAACRQARRDTMWAASRGACLTWSEATGLEVIDAIAPFDDDVRRRRLLGLQAGRPWCWLYRADNARYVARWDHAPLQAWASTPGAAIAGLRRCATDYQRIARVALPFPSPAHAETPAPIPPWPAAGYQVFVANVRRRKGFWQEAHELTEVARCYQRARAQPDVAGR